MHLFIGYTRVDEWYWKQKGPFSVELPWTRISLLVIFKREKILAYQAPLEKQVYLLMALSRLKILAQPLYLRSFITGENHQNWLHYFLTGPLPRILPITSAECWNAIYITSNFLIPSPFFVVTELWNAFIDYIMQLILLVFCALIDMYEHQCIENEEQKVSIAVFL